MSQRPLILSLDEQPPEIADLMLRLKPPSFDLEFVGEGGAGLWERLPQADYVLIERARLTEAHLGAAKRLKLIQKCGRGVEEIDVAAAHRLGIPICCTSGANSQGTAELAIMLMLAASRQLCRVHSALREGRWLKFEVRLSSHEIHGKTVGLLGIGNVGKRVARILTAGFGCNVIYWSRRRLDPDLECELGIEYSSLDDLLRRSDIVSVHVPLTPETRGLVGAREFGLMKPSAILVNTSRGPIVDHDALVEALRGKVIACAALDVFDREPPDPADPLLRLENVVLSPHCGGGTVETMTRVFQRAFANIERTHLGEPLPEEDLVRHTP